MDQFWILDLEFSCLANTFWHFILNANLIHFVGSKMILLWPWQIGSYKIDQIWIQNEVPKHPTKWISFKCKQVLAWDFGSRTDPFCRIQNRFKKWLYSDLGKEYSIQDCKYKPDSTKCIQTRFGTLFWIQNWSIPVSMYTSLTPV